MDLLILDDQQIIMGQHAYWADWNITQVDTVLEAHLKIGDGTHWDEVWLDHDLGEGEMNGALLTYMLASDYHTLNKTWDVDLFRITSMNVGVQDRMRNDLWQCRYRCETTPISALARFHVTRGQSLKEVRNA